MSDDDEMGWRDARHRAPLATDSHFRIGLAVFLIVALGYPWYWHGTRMWMEKRVAEQALRELSAATAVAQRQSEERATARKQADQTAAEAEAQAMRESEQAARDAEQAVRVAAVRVMGVLNGDPPTVIVLLGTAELEEARATICQQAERLLRGPVAGTHLTIQRYRGNEPALTVGLLSCE